MRGFWGFFIIFCSFFFFFFFLGGGFVVVFYVFSFKQSRTLMVRCRNFYLYNIAIYALRSNLSSLPLKNLETVMSNVLQKSIDALILREKIDCLDMQHRSW